MKIFPISIVILSLISQGKFCAGDDTDTDTDTDTEEDTNPAYLEVGNNWLSTLHDYSPPAQSANPCEITNPASEVNSPCGLTCVAKPVKVKCFETCLNDHFAEPQVVFPNSKVPGAWDAARSQALNPKKSPKAVVYAESTQDVQNAVTCAFQFGYKVSARGRGHSLQGMGVIDGALVIDMSRMCHPDDFVFDREAQGPGILPGSRYIATVKAGAGCTNAVMLHAVDKNFEANEGAMALIGACSSVGITGYTLGGGMGDITPYTGYAVDLLEEVEMVLYDGKVVTASKNKNSDLFWASRGGGGGNGIITSLTFKVVESPTSDGKDPAFCRIDITYDDKGEAAVRLQDYIYDSKKPNNVKFGGNTIMGDNAMKLTGIYLGSWQEAMNEMKGALLLDESILFKSSPSTLWTNYTQDCGGTDGILCSDATDGTIPSFGVEVREYASYGEMEARALCEYTILQPFWTARSENICHDLELDNKYCTKPSSNNGFLQWRDLDCNDKVVLDQLLLKSGLPNSFINRHGPGAGFTQSLNGFLLPRLESKTIKEIVKLQNTNFNHLGHGATNLVSSKATAFPWRDTGILTATISEDATNALLKDKAFKNDRNKLKGYYNYMSPEIPNWRRFYFHKNWERLTKIKGKYDPLNVFGKPLTVETPLASGCGKGLRDLFSKKESEIEI